MEVLAFTHNWNNKLTGMAFTTFRLHNPSKYQIGKRFAIHLGGKYLKQAEVVDVRVLTLGQVNEWIARLDTGYSLESFRQLVATMYKHKITDLEAQYWNLVLLQEVKANR